MSKLRQAAEQGLEALSLAFEKDLTYLSDNAMIARQDVVRGRLAVNALRAALAEREPRNQCGETCERAKLCAICTRGLEEPKQNTVTCVCGAVWDGEQMVHAPRKREWVGLTDEEMDELANRFARYGLAREIESKLKEKNGG